MNFFSKTPEIIKFGMWGPPGSGKTTYITMLQYADCDGWNVKPRGQATQDLYIEYSELLRDKKEFVPPTIVDNVSYLTFDFEKPGGMFQNKNFRVVLPEASGEYYEKPEEHPELLSEMYRYQGIIWLVDPERIEKPNKDSRSYRRMIQEWLYRLNEMQGGGTLKHYMAFCATKMDIEDYYKNIDDPKNFCLDKLGRDVEKFLGTYCDPARVAFFNTSSIGLGKDNLSSRDPDDPGRLLEVSDPINLFEPFKWLFSQF